MLYRAQTIGIAYADLITVPEIYSEYILHIPSPSEDINSLMTCITTNTSHNGMLDQAKMKLQFLHQESTDNIRRTYDNIGKEISKIIQPIRLLALCETDDKKKEKHQHLCHDFPALNTMDLAASLLSISVFYTLLDQIISMPTTPTICKIVMMAEKLDDTHPRSSQHSCQTSCATSCLLETAKEEVQS